MIVLNIVTIGKYDEALVYYKEALDASRSILGDTHQDVLVSISNMGNVFYAQGKRKSRNDCFQCILLNILIIMIVTIGKYDEALVYYKESLDARRSILGNTHPSTLVSISNMGNVLNAQGKRKTRNMISLESMIIFNVFY